eukprot:gene10478-biopygen4685
MWMAMPIAAGLSSWRMAPSRRGTSSAGSRRGWGRRVKDGRGTVVVWETPGSGPKVMDGRTCRGIGGSGSTNQACGTPPSHHRSSAFAAPAAACLRARVQRPVETESGQGCGGEGGGRGLPPPLC